MASSMALASCGDNESCLNAELRMHPFARLALLLLPLAAAGCTDPNKFAPQCPLSAVPADLGDFTRYRPGGHDLTDLVLSGRISGVAANCTAGDKPSAFNADVQPYLVLTRGPAASGRTVDVPYFIAVSRGERILDKQDYTLHAEFPPNVDELRLAGQKVELVFPTPKGVSGPDYTVSLGFRLTREELEANRARKPSS